MRYGFIPVISFALASFCAAQEKEPDTVMIPEVTDTAAAPDTAVTSDTTEVSEEPADSLTDGERARQLFEERVKQHQEKQQRLPGFSYFDSLVAYFTSDRLNRRSDIAMSWYHDAGDYFRFNPSYTILEHQVTPMRKTVQPFGLSGNRLNLLVDGVQFRPFEHIPEPDGLADMSDIPTALNHDVYLLPGAVGQVFGGESSVATLLTRPETPRSFASQSALLADRGSFEYNYIQGRYSKRFFRGRRIDMSIGYRNGDGPFLNRQSDQYHYYGDMYFPLGEKYGLHTWGHLNDRDGPLVVRPEAGGIAVSRNKFDRALRVSLTRDNKERTSHWETGYQHLRQGSYLTGLLKGRFNKTGHGLFAVRQWMRGSTIVSSRFEADYLEYDDGFDKRQRHSGAMLFQIARLNEGWRWSASAGGDWIEEFGFLPSAAFLLFREGDLSLLMLSAGYSERAPTLHELYLPYQSSPVYGNPPPVYIEEGNQGLEAEKQLVGNVLLQFGSNTTNIQASVTAGKITDGIDWRHRDSADQVVRFAPINGDIDFTNVMIQPRMKLYDFLTCLGGVSFRNIEYGAFENKAYSPDLQAFSALELHVFWPKTLMDLFAYGELTYVGAYQGYSGQDLGEELVANVKLSFAVKDYRMHFVWKNVLSNIYRSREFLSMTGRYYYYGLIWEFLN